MRNPALRRCDAGRPPVGCLVILLLAGGCGSIIDNQSFQVAYDPQTPARALRLIHGDGGELRLATTAPRLKFTEGRLGGADLAPESLSVQRTPAQTSIVLKYPGQRIGSTAVKLCAVYEIPRRQNLVRKHCRVEATAAGDEGRSLTLEEVILLDEPLPEPVVYSQAGWQSYPLFTERYFFGMEFPTGRAFCRDGQVIVSHMPGKVLNLPFSWRSRDAVVGISRPGRVRQTFENYIEAMRPNRGLHFNYNSWWSAPAPCSEADMLRLIEEIDRKLCRPFGARIDSYTVDLGWSSSQAVWRINRERFPEGFAPLNAALARQGSRLGLWWSPSNLYSPTSFDNEWARRENYEIHEVPTWRGEKTALPCIAAGTRYQKAALEAIRDLTREYGLAQMKLDGYSPRCPDSGHGHLPGELSVEAKAEGIIEIMQAVRRENPRIWIEPTCFGYEASPWWLRYADSVIGPYGDDAPRGVIPAPVYRESYTTSRDFYNLHGSVTPVPICAQEVLGIIHQSADPLYNDAVVAVLRGHQFLSLYLNPHYLDEDQCRFLAALMAWARSNEVLLARTRVLWPQSWRENGLPPFAALNAMPREIYGYAHWHDGEGILCLRNPWIARQSIDLSLDETTVGLQGSPGPLQAVQIYPVIRRMASDIPPGGRLHATLGPYETRVIHLRRATGLPPATDPEPHEAAAEEVALEGVESSSTVTVPGESALEPLGERHTVIGQEPGLRWSNRIRGRSSVPGWELYFLVEGDHAFEAIEAFFEVNGRPLAAGLIDSQASWEAPVPWLTTREWKWYVLPLPQGPWDVNAVIRTTRDESLMGSAWLMRPVGMPAGASVELTGAGRAFPLPPPGLTRASVEALPVLRLLGPETPEVREEPKIERIAGIYLDRLEPVSVAQGWGELQKNRSVTGNPLRIGSRRFPRGIGTHAPATIVYRLDGRYRAFHGLAGLDAMPHGSITVEIAVDGQTRWRSDLLRRDDPPAEFHVPLAGAVELAIVVTDGGDNYTGDHADIVQAWLEE